MARKRTPKSKKARQPLDWERPEEEIDEAPFVSDPDLKTLVFRELLEYEPRRPPATTIIEIMQVCLGRRLGKTAATIDECCAFLNSAEVSRQRLEEACTRPWFFDVELADYVYLILKQAGYCGTIDDLWRSVHGISRLANSVTSTPKVDPKLKQLLKVWIVNTGQTRKPGSRRST